MATNPRNPLQVLKEAKQIAKDHGCVISERRGLYLLYRIINGRTVYQGDRSTPDKIRELVCKITNFR